MKSGKILVVDDNKGIRDALKILLGGCFTQVLTLSSPTSLTSTVEQMMPDLILLDMNFKADINSGNEGLFWLSEIKKRWPEMPVVLFTAYADISLAVEGMKRGAADFVVKPWNNARLLETLTGIRDRKSKPKKGVTVNEGPQMLWSSGMQQLRHDVERIAPTDATVLITGENGTGKDVLAHEIHRLSGRADKPMVCVDAGAITETLFESELFGYEKGAFTDAHKSKPGRMEMASGGTLFLDEIGNLSLPMQAKLLTALEKRQIIRLGAVEPVHIDIRLICATNAQLLDKVGEGSFRQDLLYRINTIELHIPPLRERGEDIILLAQHFLDTYNRKYHKSITGLNREARNKLLKYTWPGNVRELQHILERAVILSENHILRPEDFLLPKQKGQARDFDEEELNLEKLERRAIERALRQSGGNYSLAAEMLGITRFALYRKIDKLKL